MPTYLVEIKSTDSVDDRAAKALSHFAADFPNAKRLILSRDPEPKMFNGSLALEWRRGILELLGDSPIPSL